MKSVLASLIFALATRSQAYAGPIAEPVPAQVQTAVQNYVKANGTQARPAFRHFVTDLNGDHVSDAVVLLQSPDWCGSGGCTLLVFQGQARGLKLLSASTISEVPIGVLSESHQGWKSLIVFSKGRGVVVMHFNGKGYPRNPSMQPQVTRTQMQTARIWLK